MPDKGESRLTDLTQGETRMGPIGRRSMIIGSAALALAACNPGGGANVDVSQDMSLGSADAKVTVIEYVSPTCPHCASWYKEVFPGFKAKYIDTNKVRYVMREAPIHGAVDYAVFMLARCAGKERYFNIVDGAWNSLPEFMADPSQQRSWIMRLGASAGMSEAETNACITDEKKLEAMNARVEKQMQEFNSIQYTPTFIINGKKLESPAPPTLAELSAQIDPLLR